MKHTVINDQLRDSLHEYQKSNLSFEYYVDSLVRKDLISSDLLKHLHFHLRRPLWNKLLGVYHALSEIKSRRSLSIVMKPLIQKQK